MLHLLICPLTVSGRIKRCSGKRCSGMSVCLHQTNTHATTPNKHSCHYTSCHYTSYDRDKALGKHWDGCSFIEYTQCKNKIVVSSSPSFPHLFSTPPSSSLSKFSFQEPDKGLVSTQQGETKQDTLFLTNPAKTR